MRRGPIVTHLGRSLRAYRMAEQLEQKQLAVLIGIPPATLCRLETGSYGPDAKTLLVVLGWLLAEAVTT